MFKPNMCGKMYTFQFKFSANSAISKENITMSEC